MTETTVAEDRALKRLLGAGPQVPCTVEPGDAAPHTIGEGGYYTTPSGKTRVHSPGAYGWPTVYHCSTLELRVGAEWLAQFRATVRDRAIETRPALHREIALRTGREWTRYALRGGQLTAVGVAIRLGKGFEHGKTVEDCHAEIARQAEIERLRRADRCAARVSERAARLLARVSKLTATYADARAQGYCEAGIASWCAARGVDLTSAVPLRTLIQDPDRQARAVALRVARRVIAAQEVTP